MKHTPPPRDNGRIRRTLGWIIAGAVPLGLYMSWGALLDLALAAGVPKERAWVFPLIMDIPMVVAMLIGMIVQAETRARAALPWIVFSIFTAGTIAGNAERVRSIAPDQLHVEPWVAVLVHSAPPLSVLLVTHLAAVTVYRTGSVRPARPKKVKQADRAVELRTVAADVISLPQPRGRDAARAEVLGLDADGLSRQAIADRTGVPKSTVNRWIADAKNDERRTA
jgi:hypothetical protein